MNSLHDLFEHGLKDIYDAEKKLVDALQQQTSESANDEIRAAFAEHMQETQGQVQRLNQVFERFGQQPSRGKGCAGIDGLLEEKREFTKDERPSAEILDLFNLGAAVKVERYEISAYEGLIDLANALDLGEEIVELLQENLEEEQATLETVKGLMGIEELLEREA